MTDYELSEQQKQLLYKLIYSENKFFGRDKLFKYIQEHYPDSGLSRRMIYSYISKQEIYQRLFPNLGKAKDINRTRASAPYSMLGLDLLDLSVVAYDGYHWCMTSIDYFTKKCYATPMKTKEEHDVIPAFETLLSQMKQPPRSIRSDNGSEFISDKFQALLKSKGITQILSSPNTPQSNGQVENLNKQIKRLINFQLQAKDDQNWPKMINQICDNINNSYQSTIKKTPNQAENDGNLQETKENITKAITPKNGSLDVVKFKIGDRVRLKLVNMDFSKTFKGFGWSDTIYKISKINKPRKANWKAIYYNIETEDGAPISGNFNDGDLQRITTVENPIKSPEKFIVSKILDDRINDKGDAELLIRWRGYKDTTWEPKESIYRDVPKLVEKYEKEKKAKQQPKTPPKPKAPPKQKTVAPPTRVQPKRGVKA